VIPKFQNEEDEKIVDEELSRMKRLTFMASSNPSELHEYLAKFSPVKSTISREEHLKRLS